MRHRRALLLVASTLAAMGCGSGSVPVSFRVFTPEGDEPFAEAQALTVAVEQTGVAGRQDASVLDRRRFAIDETELVLPDLPLGHGFSLLVEALGLNPGGADFIIGRGRSFPFDVLPHARPASPDVLVGTLGRFAHAGVQVPDTDIVAGAPLPGGAILATASGRLFTYEAHSGGNGTAVLTETARIPGAEGAQWAVLSGPRLVSVAGGGARVVGPDGAPVTSTPAPALAPQAEGAAVVSLPDLDAVLVLGGAPGAGLPPVDRILRLDLRGAELIQRELQPLPFPLRDGTAVAVRVRDEGNQFVTRVVICGGTTGGQPSAWAVLVDPAGEAQAAVAELGTAVSDPAVAALDAGLVLVAGGRTSSGAPSDQVRILSARAGAIDVVSPSPPPLTQARSGAGAVPFAPGLVLLVGGRGGGGAPLASAELVDARPRFFPGDVTFTGALPVPTAVSRGLALGDGTVLVGTEAGLAVYFPPRP